MNVEEENEVHFDEEEYNQVKMVKDIVRTTWGICRHYYHKANFDVEAAITLYFKDQVRNKIKYIKNTRMDDICEARYIGIDLLAKKDEEKTEEQINQNSIIIDDNQEREFAPMKVGEFVVPEKHEMKLMNQEKNEEMYVLDRPIECLFSLGWKKNREGGVYEWRIEAFYIWYL